MIDFTAIPDLPSAPIRVPLSKQELHWQNMALQPRLITGTCAITHLPYGQNFRFSINGATYVSRNRYIRNGFMELEFGRLGNNYKVRYRLENARKRHVMLEAGHNVPKLYVYPPPKPKNRKLSSPKFIMQSQTRCKY